MQKLSKSPMFQLSLGSKELFHSNFLYWLWKAEPVAFWKIMEQFGIKISDKDSLDVKREWKHFDLSIVHKRKEKIDDVLAVIENKVKSVPREDQLKEYSEIIAAIDKNGCKKILLSLIEPDWDKTEDWVNYTYEKYKDIIKQIVDSSIVGDTYNRSIIIDYYNMIEALVTFKKEWIQDGFASMLYLDIFKSPSVEDCIELRINDVRHKIIYSKMFSELKDKLDKLDIEFKTGVGTTKEIFKEGHSLTIGYGMTRATGLIETKVRINDDYLLGIQVQGNQYRHFIEFSSSSNVKELEPRKLQGMFDYGNEFEIHNQKTCSYSNAERKKTFQYVYRIIGKDETIENVVNNIVDDVKYLLERKPHLTLL